MNPTTDMITRAPSQPTAAAQPPAPPPSGARASGRADVVAPDPSSAAVTMSAGVIAKHVAAPRSRPATAEPAPTLAATGFAPQTPSVDRTSGERERRARRRAKSTPSDDGAPAGEERTDTDCPYTLDDIIQFAGETVAVHREDVRNSTWPL